MGTTAVETTPVVPQAPVAPQNAVASGVTPPATPIPEPAAVETPQQGDEKAGVQSVIDKITRRAIPEGEPVESVEAAQATLPTEATPAVADATPPVMVSEIKSDDPDGEVVLRARDPKTGQFSEMDQTRTYELSMRDRTTGETKVYNKTLPEMMRLAKDGLAMQRQAPELAYYRKNVGQWQQQHADIAQQAEGYKALAEELLTADESIVIQRRDEYARHNTPEQRLARDRADLERQRQELGLEQQRRETAARQAQASQFADVARQRLGPAIAEVERLVGQDVAAGKILREMGPFMVNGQIPPQHFPQLEAFITGPYLQWAKAEAAKQTNAQTELQKQQDELRQRQARAQASANSVGAATRPVGGMSGNASAPQGKPKNVNDAMDRIIRGNGRPVAGAA